MNFVDKALTGQALNTEIDEYVEQWHKSCTKETLAEFLGFTPEEYAFWVEKPESLDLILFCRKESCCISEIENEENTYKLAARSQDCGDIQALLAWLKETGRIK